MNTQEKKGAFEQAPGAAKEESQAANETAKAEQEPGTVEEQELFPEGTDPQYFGTGSYGLGGSNQEGNYGLGESNPQGGYGTFTDSGGYGSSTLYGLEVPPGRGSVEGAESGEPAEQAGAEKPAEKK